MNNDDGTNREGGSLNCVIYVRVIHFLFAFFLFHARRLCTTLTSPARNFLFVSTAKHVFDVYPLSYNTVLLWSTVNVSLTTRSAMPVRVTRVHRCRADDRMPRLDPRDNANAVPERFAKTKIGMGAGRGEDRETAEG